MRSVDPQSEHHFVKYLIRPRNVGSWTMRSYTCVDTAKTTKLTHFSTAVSNVTLFDSYMAALFASAEGNLAATSIEAEQN